MLKPVQSDAGWLHAFTRIIVVLVALGAAVLSFDALAAVAAAAGIAPHFTWILPVVIDGFILVATFATFALHDRGWKTAWYPWLCLGVFVILSIIGNGFHAALATGENIELPLWGAITVTSIPPIALFFAVHLLIVMLSPTAEQKREHKRRIEAEKKERQAQEKREQKEREAEARRQAAESRKPAAKTAPVAPQSSQKPAQRPQAASTPASTSVPGRTSGQPPQFLETSPEVPKSEEVVPPAQQSSAPTTSTLDEGGSMTEEEVRALFRERWEARQKLPSGAEVGRLIGFSERSGQKLAKRLKDELEQGAAEQVPAYQ